MADVLTHVLVGYVVGTVLALSDDRIGTPHVTMVMIGALSPDLKKVDLLFADATVASTLGVPWRWTALHTLGGSVAIAVLGALLVGSDHRKLVFGLIVIGALSHHALDLLLITSSGEAYPVLWPLTEYRPPTGGLYRSSDRMPLLVTASIAIPLWAIRRRYDRSRGGESVTARG